MITFVIIHFDRLSAELLSFVFSECENVGLHVKQLVTFHVMTQSRMWEY